MDSLILGFLTFTSLITGMLGGFAIAYRLPEHHLKEDSKDTVKTAWGILATMSALIVSLLLSSAKSSYDTVNNEVILSSAQIILLDQTLDNYGPETKEARDELRKRVALRIEKMWPNTKLNSPVSSDTSPDVAPDVALESGRGMRAVADKLKLLAPTNDSQRALMAKAQELTSDLILARWLIVNQARNSMPGTLIFVLVFWLSMLFTGLALYAPFNRTVVTTLLVCAFSLSSAIYLINDLSGPLGGAISISGAPMCQALNYLNRQ